MLIGRFWPIGPSGRMANWLSSHILLFVKLSVGKEEKNRRKEGVEKNLPVASFESVKCPGEQLNYFSFILNCEKYVRMFSDREKEQRPRDITR